MFLVAIDVENLLGRVNVAGAMEVCDCQLEYEEFEVIQVHPRRSENSSRGCGNRRHTRRFLGIITLAQHASRPQPANIFRKPSSHLAFDPSSRNNVLHPISRRSFKAASSTRKSRAEIALFWFQTALCCSCRQAASKTGSRHADSQARIHAGRLRDMAS